MNLSVAAQNIVLLDALGQAVQVLKQAGVSPLILTGAALAETVYSNISMRPMADIDLLIQEESIETVNECLTPLGYSLQGNEDLTFYRKIPFPVSLDFHYGIWYMPDATLQRLWQESRPVSIAGTSALTMPADETLIYTAAHAAVHHGALTSTALEDINCICRFYQPTLDWDKIVKKVKEYNLNVPIRHILSEAKLAKGAPIPGDALDRLRPSSLFQRVESGIYKSIFRAPPAANIGHLLKLLSKKGIRGKITFLVDFMFPSRAFIARRYNVSKPLFIPGYQFARPFLLAAELVKLIFRWSANHIRRHLNHG